MVHVEASPGAARLFSSLSSPYVPLGVLYFVQGFPYGLQSGLLPVLLRTRGLSLSHIGLTRVLYLPWLLKVMWSPLVDGVWGRRLWLVLCTGGLGLCCLLCSLLPPGTDLTSLAWLLLLMHILSSMQDVALDAVSVAVLTQEQVGLGNSLQVVAYKLGSVAAGGGALTLLDMLGWRTLFLLLAVGYLLATLCAWWAGALKGEEPAPRENSKETRRRWSLGSVAWSVFRVPGTGWTIVYVLIYKLGEQGSLSMVPLLLLDHGVSPSDLGLWNGILALMASIVGSTLGGMLLGKGRSIHSLLRTVLSVRLSCLVLQTLLLSALGRDTTLVKVCLLLSVVLQHFLAGVLTTATFTLMMHCTRQARPSLQASHYSLLSSLEVLGKVSFSAVSGLLVDSLGVSVSFSAFIALSCLPVLHLRNLPATLS
ncbi:PREDICTED: major facilitator superfamily domain-containing protein 3 isoform X2 [Nanorana parkeri]|uniref:major facilitator superfamily domain-containing protein 3 isoform X2 n=1 Tax=Nanorana parkeri TaxID=125878 RepID=UPI000854A68E|nr:PREDICTED: major facilitator superfamily domain-containing protein 3 isoform X2 [Nanorana parkeri]